MRKYIQKLFVDGNGRTPYLKFVLHYNWKPCIRSGKSVSEEKMRKECLFIYWETYLWIN